MGVDGLVLKGHEAGGFVGEDSTFVLLQKWIGATSLPNPAMRITSNCNPAVVIEATCPSSSAA